MAGTADEKLMPMNVDDIELEASGYKRAMPRRFSTWTLLAFAYSLTATWNSFGSALGTSLTQASSGGAIWTLTIAGVMTAVVSLGMAELSSAYPVAGAQYYWSFVVSSPEWAPFASYYSATISTLGWWLGLGSAANFVAAMILAIVSLCQEGYTPQHWHTWLVYVAIIWSVIGINVFFARWIPKFNAFVMYFSLTTYVVTIVTILACAAPNFRSGTWVFSDTTNSTGWDNNGLAFIFCTMNALYGYLGLDAGAHLCEEIPNPTVNVPKVIIYPVLLGFVTTFTYAIACMYVITDLDAVLNTPTGLPLIEVYYQATGSKAGSTVLMVAFALCFFASCSGNVTSTSRQLWSASRDDCFPFSRYWKQVSPRFNMPLNAALLEGVVVSLYGLIFLGSSSAFSSMAGACIVFMTTSYVIPQGIAAWRGRQKVLPERTFDLGRFGYPLNVLSCVWVLFIDIIYCFPTMMPVTKTNMNWISVMVVGLSIYALSAWYLSQRHVFKGPQVNVSLFKEARNETLHHHGQATLIHNGHLEVIESVAVIGDDLAADRDEKTAVVPKEDCIAA